MTPLDLAGIFALVLLAVLLVYFIVVTYNSVVGLQQRIDKAWANIDVALKQRHDQLPALVSAVRGVMTWERGLLEEVARQRAAYTPTAPIPEQAVTAEATTRAVRSLLATVEAYPEVKSQANVLDLQEEIERLEGVIADRRELYNDMIYRYNTRIGSVPAMFLAGLFAWRPRPFFRAEPHEQLRPETSLASGE